MFVPQLFGGVMVCSGVCDVTESLLSNGSGFDHVDKLRADRQGSVEVGDRFYIVAPQGPGDATCIVGLTLLWEGGYKLQSVLQRSDRIPGRGSRQRTTAIELSVLRLSCNRRVEIRQGPCDLPRLTGGQAAHEISVGPRNELDAPVEVAPCTLELSQVDVVTGTRIVIEGTLGREMDRSIEVCDLLLTCHSLLLALERSEVFTVRPVTAASVHHHHHGRDYEH